jgi:peptidyl-prolyl cis-trans isomerase D
MYGNQFSPEMMQAMGLDKQVLDSLVDQRLLLQEAKRLHLNATPDEIRKRIMDIPDLKNPDGSFVGPELYGRWVVAMRYDNPADFEEAIAREITLSKIESAMNNSIVVSPKAAEQEYRRTTENAKLRYIVYPAAREAATVQITPAEVDAYYKGHQADYTHGDQRDLRYLVADVARLRSQIVPAEADLRKRYDSSKEDFKQPESAHVLHILIKVDPSASAEVDAAARAKAEDLVRQLRGGADFAALARANSGDPSSAGQGGDMGFFNRGDMVEAFDNAAFTVPLNTISDPIRTKEYGYHIIKVLERRAAGYRTFEEVRTQLAAQAADQTAKDQARDEIARIATRLKDKKPKTVDEFASYANDKVSSNATQWFQKGDTIPGLGNNAPLATWAFTAKQGDVSEVIGTSRGPAIAYLSGIRPSGITALGEIRVKVESDARMAKARELAKTTVANAMAGTPSLDAIAAKLSIAPTETTITRQGAVSGLTGDIGPLIDAALAAPVNTVQGPVITGDSAVVFQVLEQRKFNPAEFADKRQQYVDMLRTQEARSLRQSLLARLRKDANVTINQSVLQPQQARNEQPAGM